MNIEAQDFQKELTESMRQPDPRQAPLAPVQAPRQELKPMPQTPSRPDVEAMPTAPAPTLVNINNGRNAALKTQTSARSQVRQASQGAGALRIPRKKSGSSRNASRSIGLNIPT